MVRAALGAELAATTLLVNDLNRPPLDLQRLAVQERVGDLAVRGFDDSAEGRPRHLHLTGRLFLIQAFAICQPNRFELVETDDHDLQVACGDAGGLEYRGHGLSGDVATTKRAGHG
jgi:hypothetical protein